MLAKHIMDSQRFLLGYCVKSDPHPLTSLNLAKLSIEHDEIDGTSEDDEVDVNQKVVKWLSLLETPGSNNPNMCPPDQNHIREGNNDDIPSEASVMGVKVGYHPFETSDDGKLQPTYGREIMTAHDTCLQIYDMHQWKQDMDEKPMGWQRPMQTRVQTKMQMQTPTPLQTPTQVHRPSVSPQPNGARTLDWDDLGKRRKAALPQ